MRYSLLFGLFALSLFSSLSFAELTHYMHTLDQSDMDREAEKYRYVTTCKTVNLDQRTTALDPRLPKSFRYCLSRHHWAKSEKLIYFFHGVYGDPQDWQRKLAMYRVRREWRKLNMKHLPATVSLSFGDMFYLGVPHLRKLFFERVVPLIEREVGGEVKSRVALGVSMGGGNVSQLVLQAPQGWLKGAAMVCPAITAVNPWSGPLDLQQYYQRSAAWEILVEWLLIRNDYLLENFANKNEFEREGDSLALARTRLGPWTPPLYLSAGTQDELGFDLGTRAFAALATAKQVPTQLQLYSGKGHCSEDAQKLAQFLAKWIDS